MNKISKNILVAAMLVATISLSAEGTGKGITIEAFGSYGFAQPAPIDWVATNNVPGAFETTSNFFKYEQQKGRPGIGFGVNFGYDIVANVAAMIGYNFQSLSSENQKGGNYNGSTRIDTTKISITAHFVNLGIRPSVAALGGIVYGGGGALLGIPSLTYEQSSTVAGNDQIIKTSLNLALGYYGEFGYQYKITDAISVGLGVRINVLTSSNNGKESSSVSGSGAGTTTKYKWSDTPASETCPANTSCSKPATFDVGSTQVQLVVGYKL